MFAQSFGPVVSEGDRISCQIGRFTATATVCADICSGAAPDQRDDGFWPSRDPQAAGFVRPEDFDAEQAKAQRVMDAWNNDKWFYGGIAVTVECDEVQLIGRYECALWGVECNYPDSDNSYLSEVANELLGDAIGQAEAKLAKLCRGA